MDERSGGEHKTEMRERERDRNGTREKLKGKESQALQRAEGNVQKMRTMKRRKRTEGRERSNGKEKCERRRN